jgi:predicted O-methyltransferase YrrM
MLRGIGVSGKLSRWLRVGLRHPVEFVDRLAIAMTGRADASASSRDEEHAVIAVAPVGLWDLAALFGLGPGTTAGSSASLAQLEREWEDVWMTIDYRAGHDADPALVRVIWLLCRILRPRIVVETGVGRGVSTSVILAALERNGDGRLISIDLPPLSEPWYSASAELVPDTLRHRWEYRRGSVRRELPRLLGELTQRDDRVDLHVGDSLHTAEHVQWEVAQARSALRRGAFIVMDDVMNWVTKYPDISQRTVLRHETKDDAFAVIRS